MIRFDVKVESDTPVIDNADVLGADAPIFINFEGSRVVFYGDSVHNAKMSVSAGRAMLVKEPKQAPPPPQKSVKQ